MNQRTSTSAPVGHTVAGETTRKPHQPHRGEPVQVGPYTVYLGGTQHFQAGDVDNFDVLIPLTETGLAFGETFEVNAEMRLPKMPKLTPGHTYQVLALPNVDFQPPPDNFGDVLREKVIPLLAAGKKVVAFCAGSHGRTGTFLADLIAIVEPEIADPIAAARERHCGHAVETPGQVAAIRKLHAEARASL